MSTVDRSSTLSSFPNRVIGLDVQSFYVVKVVCGCVCMRADLSGARF